MAFDGDDEATKVFFQEKFDELFLDDKDFNKKAVNCLAFFDRPERDEFNFTTKDEYERHEESFKNISLDGKKLKSREEVQIANSYALNTSKDEYLVSSRKVRKGMKSPKINEQLSRHYSILMGDLVSKNVRRIEYKAFSGKLKKIKRI